MVGSFYNPTRDATTAEVTFLLAPALVGAISAISGALLLLREPTGLYSSFLVQGFQVLNFGGPVRLVYLAGLKASLLLFNTGLIVSAGFGGEFALGMDPPDAVPAGSGILAAASLGYDPSGL